MTIKLPAYFQGFNSKADHSASLRFSTQEVTDQDFAEFQRNLNEFGWLAFQPNADTAPELPQGDAEEKGKSLSERLYDVLFVRWTQLSRKGECDESFEHYRKRYMEAQIEMIKSKLDPS